METKERLTYARQELLELVKNRELRAWCNKRNLPHTSVYKVAVGTAIPSFAFVCSMIPYFAPALWVYYTDEEIPYECNTLPEWNPDDFSLFIKKHKIDYKAIAEKYGLTDANAKNIFLHRRANFSLMQIRKMASEVNPEDFFVSGDEMEDGRFYPERGDIVSLSGKNILVLSKATDNRTNKSFAGIIIEEKSENSIQIKGGKISGHVSAKGLGSFTYVRINPALEDKVSEETIKPVLSMVQNLFR